jgi:protein-S-isoprenylcysteine O-methyltransferase Ste14
VEAILRAIAPTLWLAWLTYWWASARHVKVTRRREPLGSQLLHRVPVLLAAFLFVAPRLLSAVLTRRFMPDSTFVTALGSGLVGFSVWARRHLGRNWSASVAIKEDHALVRRGPYRYLRHPIYARLLRTAGLSELLAR